MLGEGLADDRRGILHARPRLIGVGDTQGFSDFQRRIISADIFGLNRVVAVSSPGGR